MIVCAGGEYKNRARYRLAEKRQSDRRKTDGVKRPLRMQRPFILSEVAQEITQCHITHCEAFVLPKTLQQDTEDI